MKYLITGGTGFIGRKLCSELLQNNNEIIVLSRSRDKVKKLLGGKVEPIESLNEISDNAKIDIVINLAGEGIADKRWTDEQKQKLVDSRVNITKDLISFFIRLKNKPKTFISASAIGYYGSHGDESLTETSKPNDEFTHQLCKLWEAEAKKAESLKIRTCIIRLGVVLGASGGTIKKLILPFKMGAGGKIGNGKQHFSWVHIADVTSAISHLAKTEKLSGIYNLTAPKAVTNEKFTKALGSALNKPTLLPMPAFMVKALFGEMGEALLLNGQNVYPKNLLDAGFEFEYPTINNALNEIVQDV